MTTTASTETASATFQACKRRMGTGATQADKQRWPTLGDCYSDFKSSYAQMSDAERAREYAQANAELDIIASLT